MRGFRKELQELLVPQCIYQWATRLANKESRSRCAKRYNRALNRESDELVTFWACSRAITNNACLPVAAQQRPEVSWRRTAPRRLRNVIVLTRAPNDQVNAQANYRREAGNSIPYMP